MAMTPYSGDTSIIGKLGTTPQERGLTTQQFKDKFDEGLKAFVEWFNTTHLTEFSPEEIIRPTLLNGWKNFGANCAPVGYYKDSFGLVHITGSIEGGPIPSIAFVLPTNYRPLYSLSYAVASYGDKTGIIRIDTNGNVVIVGGVNGFIALNIPPFRTDA